MIKLYLLKKGNKKFYVCSWDCGAYSIERITKSFGGSVCFMDTLDQIEEYEKNNGFRKVG